MKIYVPVPDKDARKQLGELLRRCRVEFNLSLNDVARRAGASYDDVKAWEEGDAVPRGKQWPRLKASFGRLSGATQVWQAALRLEMDADEVREAIALDADTTLPPAIEPLPEPTGELPALVDPRSEKNFGAALARARVNEGLAQREVSELLEVDPTTISSWEHEQTVPVLANYRKLVELFPILKGCIVPASRDLEKPPGNTTDSYRPGRPPGVPSAPSPIAPPNQIQRVSLAPAGPVLPGVGGGNGGFAPAMRSGIQTNPSSMIVDDVDRAGIALARARRSLSEAQAEISIIEAELARARDRAKEAEAKVEQAEEQLFLAISSCGRS